MKREETNVKCAPEINKKDLKFMKTQRNKHSNMKIRLRFNVLWLSRKIGTARLIAEITGVSERQVFNIIKIYNNNLVFIIYI